MNRSLLKAGCILSVFLLLLAVISCNKKPPQWKVSPQAALIPATLRVPLIPQLADEWCWAACTEMVTTYYHNALNHNAPIIRQCQLVNSRVTGGPWMDCDTIKCGNVPAYFDFTGSPFPGDSVNKCFGYSRSFTPGRPWGIAAIPVDTLIKQIKDSLPVIFEWSWKDLLSDSMNSTGLHYLIAEGIPYSSYIKSHIFISILDPDPTGVGGHSIITYPEYASDKPLVIPGCPPQDVFSNHGTDCYNISYPK